MDPKIQIYSSPEELAHSFSIALLEKIQKFSGNKRNFNIALSGGSTSRLFFKILAENYSQKINWDRINLFWGDERCVMPNDPDSNFGITKRALLNYITIPGKYIFRIQGEDDPYIEAERYSRIIMENVITKDGLPSFDLIMLGVGEDGHTASIFPDQLSLLNSDKICEVAIHPVSDQKRITITGRVINNANWIVFLITGEKKASVISKILKKQEEAKVYPAFYIHPTSGDLEWYLDLDATIQL